MKLISPLRVRILQRSYGIGVQRLTKYRSNLFSSPFVAKLAWSIPWIAFLPNPFVEKGGVMASFIPALLNVRAKLVHFRRRPMRRSSFWKLSAAEPKASRSVDDVQSFWQTSSKRTSSTRSRPGARLRIGIFA
jgi:hypothetical protein